MAVVALGNLGGMRAWLNCSKHVRVAKYQPYEKKEMMEMRGIEPRTSSMLKRCHTTRPHPPISW